MDLKEIFKDGVLSYEDFSKAITDNGIKLADLSTGEYVSKQKYDNEISTRDKTINTLNSTLSTRDNDIKDLQNKLKEAGNDADKLATLNTDLTALQEKYNKDTADYQAKLTAQAYEFAVKDFANTQKFTSNAAKRDFISSMINTGLKFEDGKIFGANDFVTSYQEQNQDAFVVEKNTPTAPKFTGTTNPTNNSSENTPKFSFTFGGVRPIPKESD